MSVWSVPDAVQSLHKYIYDDSTSYSSDLITMTTNHVTMTDAFNTLKFISDECRRKSFAGIHHKFLLKLVMQF